MIESVRLTDVNVPLEKPHEVQRKALRIALENNGISEQFARIITDAIEDTKLRGVVRAVWPQ